MFGRPNLDLDLPVRLPRTWLFVSRIGWPDLLLNTEMVSFGVYCHFGTIIITDGNHCQIPFGSRHLSPPHHYFVLIVSRLEPNRRMHNDSSPTDRRLRIYRGSRS